jgi:succinate-semialdehyde dehydrogenase/glutarate-semialdehyde dehydrogenase
MTSLSFFRPDLDRCAPSEAVVPHHWGAYIDGAWIGSSDGREIIVYDPADGAVVGTVPSLGAEGTRAAIDAAHRALPAWQARTAAERAAILRRWYDLVLASEESLARLMVAEQGKPIAEARAEIRYAAGFIEWFSEEARRIYGDVIPPHMADKRLFVFKQPVGVVAAITPWNFPSAMVTRKAAPALAAGCTLVLKPASQTPFSALALAALGEQAGLPPGVFNVVTGSAGEIGGVLTASPLVRKLSFTGSTEVGKRLMAASAGTLKRLSLELGGNAPFIVFDDADLDVAVEAAIVAKFRNTGQTCVCANRLFVQAGIYDRFAAQLGERVTELAVGAGLEPATRQGPLIDPAALVRVEEHIADALGKGAVLLAGGARHAKGGNFFQPTILGEVGDDMLIAREETFGPVAPLLRFAEEEEALARANATEFGLAAYIFTRDYARLLRVAERLDCGMVGANTGLISTEVAPFGGTKQSGNGREGSKYGIDDYLEIKYLCIGGVA